MLSQCEAGHEALGWAAKVRTLNSGKSFSKIEYPALRLVTAADVWQKIQIGIQATRI